MIKFDRACKAKIADESCEADCCGNVPLPFALWEKYIHLAKGKYDVVRYDPLVVVTTKHLHCIFLDRIKCRCKVYDERPSICRQFGLDWAAPLAQCPHIWPNGDARTRAERRRFQRGVGDRIAKISNQLVKENIQQMRSEMMEP